jgi:ectoine hydroxylase-related dioxygenase (phytanoyl-CoA dioxygenase family)
MTAQSDMPLLAFVGLQNDTPLRVWPGSWRALHAAWRGAPLPALPSGGRMHRAVVHTGDLLLFRPDLVHAGDGFDEPNFRLHAYLMSQVSKGGGGGRG